MADDVIPGGPFGARVRRRLTDEQAIWLITVGRDGTPQPNPVWFLWDGADSLLVYNRTNAKRLAHVARSPRVSLHLDSDGGSDVVVLTGTARAPSDDPAVPDNAAYLEKYRSGVDRVSGSPEQFGRTYSVPMRISLDRVRGF